MMNKVFHGTTIIGFSVGDKLAIGGDGQVTLGEEIFKAGAKKVRKIDGYDVLVGFAGAAADGLTLLDRFEEKLSEYSGNVQRSVVELAKDWRMDRYLRRLEAMLVVISRTGNYVLSGNGDVIEPDDGICAIGSGGGYALAAARALLMASDSQKCPADIVKISLEIASGICIFTNSNITILTI
ncbi:MAG TPA: ATP-dependent protease subunit HslV [candidate division Zixibacteria bacterium]|nr:ATP-dependent protease subunit HslV [candidate division Zixibacteria bacterium]